MMSPQRADSATIASSMYSVRVSHRACDAASLSTPPLNRWRYAWSANTVRNSLLCLAELKRLGIGQVLLFFVSDCSKLW
jgi:hypothetical protein